MTITYFKYALAILLYLPVTTLFAGDNTSFYWLDYGGPFDGSTLSINESNGRNGWGISYSKFLPNDWNTSTYNNNTGKEVYPGAIEFSISRLFHYPSQYSTKTLSIGLAYVKETTADSCRVEKTLLSGNKEYCDISNRNTIGIPMQADIAWGRYAAYGFFARALIAPNNGYFMAGISFQLGKFYLK